MDLDLFQRKLGETIVDCGVLLRKIEEEKSILAKIETYVPTSPVNYTSHLCDYY